MEGRERLRRPILPLSMVTGGEKESGQVRSQRPQRAGSVSEMRCSSCMYVDFTTLYSFCMWLFSTV